MTKKSYTDDLEKLKLVPPEVRQRILYRNAGADMEKNDEPR